MTLHDLAGEYGVSAERIRQIEVAAMKKMRKALAEAPEPAPVAALTKAALQAPFASLSSLGASSAFEVGRAAPVRAALP